MRRRMHVLYTCPIEARETEKALSIAHYTIIPIHKGAACQSTQN